MPDYPYPTCPAKERARIVAALRKGARLLGIRRAGEETITLNGEAIPRAWIIALGRQGVITPARIDKYGAGDSATLYGLTLAFLGDSTAA